MWGRIKVFWGSHRDTLLTVLVMFLVTFASFQLGRLSVLYGQGSDFTVVEP